MEFIKKLFVRFFVTIGILTTIIIVCAVLIIKSLSEMKDEVEEKSVLNLNMSMVTGDVNADGGFYFFDSFLSKKVSLIDALLLIKNAATDQKILGIFADLSQVDLSYAQIEELRNEIIKFRKSGKPAYCWGDSFGEITNGTKNYYLATAFDKIFTQPSGMVGFNGLSSESIFFKGTLEKLNIEPIGSKRKEYKTYWNMFSEDKYTPEHKESSEALINSIFQKIVEEVALSRQISVDSVKEIADSFALPSDKAIEKKLIDGVIFKDDAFAELKKTTNFEKVISAGSYKNLQPMDFGIEKEGKIALIELPGSIHRGNSDFGPSGYPQSSGSETVLSMLKKAEKDEDIKGIIIRVNSPGGSVVASETIWNQIKKMSDENKKPLVISMGTVAASGGYYVSMPAQKIFADHSTITGSIGVVLGKMYTREFFKKLGITFDTVSTGKNTDIFSSLTRLEEDQKVYVENSLDSIYKTFVQRAADGRKMEYDALEKNAKGRVWTGAQAKERGLVDEVGGFMETLDYMNSKIGMGKELKVVKYPESDKIWEMILGRDDDSSGFARWMESLAGTLNMMVRTVNFAEREFLNQENENFQLRNDTEIR
ncbi:MAG TPA: signal peptide peptidase SppA [bacterium]|nr:signal peptide peptidase SppA [bacterium]HPS30079.1 signal peptide peptidase SppA [bacterium]